MEFDEAWTRVAELAGRSSGWSRGERFCYAFKRTFVVVAPGRLSLSKTNFRKVFLQGSDAGVQGRRHIRAILEDSRVAARMRETEPGSAAS